MDTTETTGPPPRRMIECQDCDQLDAFGWDESGYADIGRKHAIETGHHVIMWAEHSVPLTAE